MDGLDVKYATQNLKGMDYQTFLELFNNGDFLQAQQFAIVGKVNYNKELYNEAFAIANVTVPPLTIAAISAISVKTFK
jgi:hypothetical protein